MPPIPACDPAARHNTLRRLLPLLTLGVGLGGCAAAPFGRPGTFADRRGDEIVVCGQLVHTGAPVVLWFDPSGYDAYRAECRFIAGQERPTKPVSDALLRYDTFRRNLPESLQAQIRERGWTLPELQEHVQQFVIHYDACGSARKCFQVLHDVRGLSVHFLLDLDGTIYQTLDLKERAWHAGEANDRSVGVEIAHIGAYPDTATLNQWYRPDAHGRLLVTFPPDFGPTGIRTPHFVARPARNELIAGEIHGRRLYQYDFTNEQYESLIRLTATLCRVLPRIRPDCPRTPDGRVRWDVLTSEERAQFSGVLGHCHITTSKVDPGPAFDWERVLHGARRRPRGYW